MEQPPQPRLSLTRLSFVPMNTAGKDKEFAYLSYQEREVTGSHTGYTFTRQILTDGKVTLRHCTKRQIYKNDSLGLKRHRVSRWTPSWILWRGKC